MSINRDATLAARIAGANAQLADNLADKIEQSRTGIVDQANAKVTSTMEQEIRMAAGFTVTSGGKVNGYKPVPPSPNIAGRRSLTDGRGATEYVPPNTSSRCGSAAIHMEWDWNCDGTPDSAQPAPTTNLDFQWDLDGNGIPDETQSVVD